MPYKNHANKPLDVAIFGASGYTGRLVAEYFKDTYPAGSGVAWAMVGRSAEKLAQVRDEIGAPADTPLLVANADDPASLRAVADQAKVILTTVGPYQLYGDGLVALCAETGTDYVDLCGEPAWMRTKIDAHHAKAQETGARIVFSCGFDSIPFDLSVLFLQNAAKEKLGGPCGEIRGLVRRMEGKFSGGTAASLKATMAAAGKDPSILQTLMDPFALTPGFKGADQPSGSKPKEDPEFGWLAPFIMAPINTKNIHRSNHLMGAAYGEDFKYSEMMMTGPGPQGAEIAKAVASDNSLMSDDAPKPGEGPTKEERESGFYDVLFVGTGPGGGTIKASVYGDKDPGYGSTSKMIAESALCLVQDVEGGGGVLTPAPALGTALISRLQKSAGLTFKLE
ncbi:MAG: saccharopine dehydrogenase NADP-binding domain-containing protein [Pseudomonadota bacterium]